MGKTMRKARERGSVLLWGLVALLVWAAASVESVELVGAQTFEPTDTTAVPAGSGEEQDSGGGVRSDQRLPIR